MTSLNILITGGTGFIGSALTKHLKNQHKVTVLSRHPSSAQKQLGFDVKIISCLNDLNDLDPFDAVINLAGEPIANKRWSKRQKSRITGSRWHITSTLVQLMHTSNNPPSIFLSGSAIGIYGRQGNETIDESFTDHHDEFSHQICQRWEELAEGKPDNVRLCIMRTGIVLGTKGGALKRMLPPFRFGLGGPLASGEQYMSWIHINDMVKAIIFLLDHPTANGVFNLTAPSPCTNQEFTDALGKQLERPAEFRLPRFLLRLLFGEMADLLIYGQRVVPSRLHEHGFHFCHSRLDEALASLLARPKTK
ncbi:TIGR01777 family oxidoreductase [Corallincola holothuriorum]|uniref:TIGR01777 family oxidoreductase n=1 Tax=Corallincola holothuriorum TaxID=2282215 RepID=UPI002D794BEF|nr:TIGR01777 family oxidoreductase [Corallincola holothuriorum]